MSPMTAAELATTAESNTNSTEDNEQSSEPRQERRKAIRKTQRGRKDNQSMSRTTFHRHRAMSSFAIGLAFFMLASGIAGAVPPPVSVSYGTIGTGATAIQIGPNVQLYTPNGLIGSAYVRMDIPGGIQLGAIASLSYTAQVTVPGAGGFAPEVVLNMDADSDGTLEGTGIDWMLSSYVPAILGYVSPSDRGDNFLSGDNWPPSAGVPDPGFVNRNAIGANYYYWEANNTRNGFGSTWTPISSIAFPIHDIDTTDMVYSIDFVVGTSGNFNGMTAVVQSVELNGTTYPVLPPPTTVWVDDDFDAGNAGGHVWQYDAFDNVQDGINAVASGGTVNVAPGTYTERIVITKPLSVLGPTANINKNGYPAPAGYAWDDSIEAIINNPSGGPYNLVDINSVNDVVFRGFVVQSLDIPAYQNMANLVRVYADSPGTCNNIVVENNIIGPNTNLAAQDGTRGRMGLYLATPTYPTDGAGITNSSFRGNKIFDCLGNGNNVFVWGAAENYGSPANANYTGTVIEDNEISGSHRSGIEIAGGVDNLVIRSNNIHGNSGFPGDDPANLAYGNGIVVIRMGSDKTSPTAFGSNNLHIVRNNIHGNEKNGIYLGPMNTGHLIAENTISGNGWDAVRVDLNESYHGGTWPVTNIAANIVAYSNSITGNGSGVRVIGTPSNGFVLDAGGNWWGSQNSGAVANAVSANVDYTPWCARDNDTSPDPGYQADFESLWVDDDSPQIGPLSRIKEGIDMVTGSVVNLAGGTYNDGEIVLDKPGLTLRGAWRDGCIIDASGSSRGIRVEVDNVTVRNLTVKNATHRNITVYSGGSLVVNNLHLENLLSTGSISGFAIHHSTVNNLTMVDCTATGNTGHGMRVDTAGYINGWVVSNCHFDGNDAGLTLYGGVGVGAMFNHTTFNGNVANSGASWTGGYGMYVGWGSPDVTGMTFNSCQFRDNRANYASPATFSHGIELSGSTAAKSITWTSFSNCDFSGNQNIGAQLWAPIPGLIDCVEFNSCTFDCLEQGFLHNPGSGGATNVTLTSNSFVNHPVHVADEPGALDINNVLATNTFDKYAVVDHPGSSLLHVIWGRIQPALNASVSGDSVIVSAGVFNEDLTAPAGVAMLGVQVGVDARGRTAVPESVIVGSLRVNSATATTVVDGFALTGTGVGPLAGVNARIESSTVVVKNNIFNTAAAIGGYTYSGFLDLDNVYGAVISGNSFAGNYDGPRAPNVIRVGVSGAGVVDISDNEMHDVGGGGGIGLMVNNPNAVINIEGNVLDNTGDGVWLWNPGAARFAALNVTDNDIVNCLKRGVNVVGVISTDSGSVEIHQNRFANITQEAVFNGVAGYTINADRNWWNHVTGPDHPSNPHGTGQGGEAVSDGVSFMPGYANATTEPGTEWVSVVHNPLIILADNVQDAIDGALPGDTVQLVARTFGADDMRWDGRRMLYINKPLNLQGAGSGATMLDAQHAHSALTDGKHCVVVWVESSDVSFEGLTALNGDWGFRMSTIDLGGAPMSDFSFTDVGSTGNYGTGIVFETDVSAVDMANSFANANGDRGIYFAPGCDAQDVELVDTSAAGNVIAGFNCQGTMQNLAITGGSFSANSGGLTAEGGGPYYGFGISLENVTNVILNGVTANANGTLGPAEGGAGIVVKGDTNGVDILNTTLQGNNTAGLWVEDPWTVANLPGPFANDVEIHNSSITGNALFGVHNWTTNIVDAINNWWGAADGPGPVGPGSGDNVSQYVRFGYWALDPGFSAFAAGMPIAYGQSVTTNEDTPVAITLTGDYEPGLVYSIVSKPAHGTLSGAPPAVAYQPAANYNGTDSFTFQVDDGVGSDTATVNIAVLAVNDPPLMWNVTWTVWENTLLSQNVCASMRDIDGDTLTVSYANLPEGANLTGGEVAYPYEMVLTWTPDFDQGGPGQGVVYPVDFTVSDGKGGSDTGIIYIRVIDSAEPTPTATDTPVPVPPTATPTDTPVPEPTATDTPEPEPTATPTDTPEPVPTDTPEPTASPTATPEPTATPTVTPTATPVPPPEIEELSVEAFLHRLFFGGKVIMGIHWECASNPQKFYLYVYRDGNLEANWQTSGSQRNGYILIAPHGVYQVGVVSVNTAGEESPMVMSNQVNWFGSL